MTEPCNSPLDLMDLVAYRVGELDATREAEVEEHYFSCAECSKKLAWLDSVSEAVRSAVLRGEISLNVSSGWVSEAEQQGLCLRTYEIDAGGTVHCTIAPREDFVIVRLRVGDIPRGALDADIVMTDLESGRRREHKLTDVTVDREHRELLYAFAGPTVRAFPRSLFEIRLRRQGSSEAIGSYTMDHTPWSELAEPR